MLVNIKKKYEETDNCGLIAVTDDLFMHSSLPPATKQIQVINKRCVKSTQKLSNCKKRCGSCKKRQHEKKLWNQRWRPRSGCDGRILAKFLIIAIQLNLVPIPRGANTNLPELLLLKILPLSYHHSLFWATTFDFTTFFILPFLHRPHLFYSLAVFV